MKETISIIDDNTNLLATLSISLKIYNYNILTFNCPDKAIKYHSDNPANFYIIDISMPKKDGFQVYKELCRIHKSERVPAIFLTAIDTMEGRSLKTTSISDYVTKPFNLEGLIARIDRIMNKFNKKNNVKILKIGNLIMDDDKMQTLWFGKEVILTKKEYYILRNLAQHPGKVSTRGALLDIIYGENYNITDRVIDSHIKRIRIKFRKVHPQKEKFNRIITYYGIGYKWVPQSLAI